MKEGWYNKIFEADRITQKKILCELRCGLLFYFENEILKT